MNETQIQQTETQSEDMLSGIDTSELMTPEELALFKKLQAKRKAQQKMLGTVKDELFQNLTQTFGQLVSRAKTDVSTVSTKEPYTDGNIYAVSFGVDEDKADEVDHDKVTRDLLDKFLPVIESIMGVSNSMKITGTFSGKKLFWQVRKRSA